jgi:hypothetical protein
MAVSFELYRPPAGMKPKVGQFTFVFSAGDAAGASWVKALDPMSENRITIKKDLEIISYLQPSEVKNLRQRLQHYPAIVP